MTGFIRPHDPLEVDSVDPVESDTTITQSEVSAIPVDSSNGAVAVTLGDELAYDEHLVKVIDVGGSAGTNNIEITAQVGNIGANAGVTLISNYTAAEFVYLESESQWFVTNEYNANNNDSSDGGLIGGLL